MTVLDENNNEVKYVGYINKDPLGMDKGEFQCLILSPEGVYSPRTLDGEELDQWLHEKWQYANEFELRH